MKNKRYIVTLAISVWAENDKEASKKATYIKRNQDHKYDNRPQIIEVEAVEGLSLRDIKHSDNG